MDADRARELLARERTRIEQALASHYEGPLEGDDRVEPGDLETRTSTRTSSTRAAQGDLRDQLAALERAEARLAEGTYGLSVESGKPIPDERLEAAPLAERTIEEQERWERGGY